MPDLRPEPIVGDGVDTFTQTVGGRTALPDAAPGAAGRRSCG